MLQMDRKCSFVLDMHIQAAKQALKPASRQLQAHQDGQAKDAGKPGALQAIHAFGSKLSEAAAVHADGSRICQAAAAPMVYTALRLQTGRPVQGDGTADMQPAARSPFSEDSRGKGYKQRVHSQV